MSATNRLKNPCPNERCGNTLYEEQRGKFIAPSGDTVYVFYSSGAKRITGASSYYVVRYITEGKTYTREFSVGRKHSDFVKKFFGVVV